MWWCFSEEFQLSQLHVVPFQRTAMRCADFDWCGCMVAGFSPRKRLPLWRFGVTFVTKVMNPLSNFVMKLDIQRSQLRSCWTRPIGDFSLQQHLAIDHRPFAADHRWDLNRSSLWSHLVSISVSKKLILSKCFIAFISLCATLNLSDSCGSAMMDSSHQNWRETSPVARLATMLFCFMDSFQNLCDFFFQLDSLQVMFCVKQIFRLFSCLWSVSKASKGLVKFRIQQFTRRLGAFTMSSLGQTTAAPCMFPLIIHIDCTRPTMKQFEPDESSIFQEQWKSSKYVYVRRRGLIRLHMSSGSVHTLKFVCREFVAKFSLTVGSPLLCVNFQPANLNMRKRISKSTKNKKREKTARRNSHVLMRARVQSELETYTKQKKNLHFPFVEGHFGQRVASVLGRASARES